MQITFLGAAKTVTGSCYLVETTNARFLVDCGMFQGKAAKGGANAIPPPMDAVDFVLLTHAHIDHSGRIPKLWLDGYRNPVHATKATADLCGIMLPDSGYIQEMEAEWENRKRLRAGKPPVQPLYTHGDAMETLKLFKPKRYDDPFTPAPGIRAAFRDAGHILGSSILELWVEEGGKEFEIVFSGDLGYQGKPILRDPAIIESADCLILESTYGNRRHEDGGNKADRLLKIINETVARGGNVVIPAFAIGRTQEIVYELNRHRETETNRHQAFARIPVYVDSPLAVSATMIYRQNMDCFDEEAQRYLSQGDNPLDFHNLHFVKDMEQSRRLNTDGESKLILSASGMCDAGRIKHHLKHNLWRRESAVVFVGYQAEGTLGRRIVDGAKYVRLFGETIRVNARIEKLDGFSGHADQEGLLGWLGGFQRKPGKIILVHGEDKAAEGLATAIRMRFGIEPVIPGMRESITLGEPVAQGSTAGTEAVSRKREAITLLDGLRARLDSATDEQIMDLSQKLTELGIELK